MTLVHIGTNNILTSKADEILKNILGLKELITLQMGVQV